MLRVAGCPFAESCKRIVAYNILTNANQSTYPSKLERKKKQCICMTIQKKNILNFEALNF